jgi:hypothetical protein
MNKLNLSWLSARLQEPSTYAGLAAMLSAFGLSLDAGLLHDVMLIGTGLGGLVAFVLPQAKQ